MSANLYNLPLMDQIAYECFARWGVKVIERANVEPITLQQAKLHLRVDDEAGSPSAHPDDPLITALITAARQWCEAYSGFSFAEQTVELGGRAFNAASAFRYNNQALSQTNTSGYSYYSSYIELPLSPVSQILEVNYTSDLGVSNVVSAAEYVLDDYVRPPRLYAAAGTVWPLAKADSPNVCRIRYRAGYNAPGGSPDPNPIPEMAIAAIKLMLTHLYENRAEVEQAAAGSTLSHQIPLGAQALLDMLGRTRLGFA